MSRSLSEATEPSLRQLSHALGVPELRCGRHALRDQKGWLDDKIEVGYLWHALVMPSFHPWAAIGLVHMKQSEFRGKDHPSIMRAAMVVFDQEGGQARASSATEVNSDPLAEEIRGLQVLPGTKSVFLDGIGYRICTSDWEVEATIHLHNPRSASLRAVEKSLFQIATTIQSQTGNHEITAYLNLWQGYLKQ
jgi:hypothetical protein